MSTDELCCWKCGKAVKPDQLDYSWVYTTDTNEPHHLYKCLYEGEEVQSV